MQSFAVWARRAGLGLLLLAGAGIVSGSIYERMVRRQVDNAYPPAGRLVDIGGRKLHLDCRGQGSPTILFEAGLDSYGSLSWSEVHGPLARTTRACAYDRAGIMWSDPSPHAPTWEAVATDLHTLLRAAGESGPYIMVGHSFAGPWLTTYTKAYGSDVAGLVFVDTSHPDQQEFMKRMWGREIEVPFILRALATAAPVGITRLILGSSASAHAAAPAAANRAMSARLPRSLGRQVEELEQINSTLAEAGTARSFGDRPLIVLTGPKRDAGMDELEEGLTTQQIKGFERAWSAMQAEQARWSTQGRQRIVPNAGHYIQFDQPVAVIEAVRKVVNEVRDRKRVTTKDAVSAVNR